MARALRRPGLIAPAALVAVSTFAYALAGRRVQGLWIMPDEAIYADRALRLWHHGSLPVFRGQGAAYGLLYPVLAAAPLALGDLASLKLVQAFAMSLAAVPVFLYARRLMSLPYAIVAAALTLASPLLLYSGFVMTEVLFYPLAALTLLAVARAVETSSFRVLVFALALIAVTACTVVAVCVQVGFFAARFAPHLLGRDLASLPPLLFLVFALWLSRGLPRRPWLVGAVCLVVLAVLVLAPWNDLILLSALPDSFETALVYRVSASIDAARLVTVVGLALLVAFALVPRRAAPVLPLLVGILLVARSVSAFASI